MLLSAFFFTVLSAITGCQKEAPKSTPKPTSDTQTPASVTQTGTARSPRIAEWEKPYEWNREQIKRHHAKLVLAELPEYIGEVWGCGGKDPEGGILSNWAFVVPQKTSRTSWIISKSWVCQRTLSIKTALFALAKERIGLAPNRLLQNYAILRLKPKWQTERFVAWSSREEGVVFTLSII